MQKERLRHEVQQVQGDLLLRRECQNKDWKTHKKVCAQMAVGKVASSFEKL